VSSFLDACDYHFAASLDGSNWFDLDVNIASQRIEVAKESIAGESRDTASNQFGHFGLIDAENVRHLILAESFSVNELSDLFR